MLPYLPPNITHAEVVDQNSRMRIPTPVQLQSHWFANANRSGAIERTLVATADFLDLVPDTATSISSSINRSYIDAAVGFTPHVDTETLFHNCMCAYIRVEMCADMCAGMYADMCLHVSTLARSSTTVCVTSRP